MKYLAIVAVTVAAISLTGCAGGFSGYSSTTTFKCSAPEGVSCNSISGNYANALAGTFGPNEGKTAEVPGNSYFGDSGRGSKYNPANRMTPSSGTPVRTQTEVLRIWIAPFQDNDGDLFDQAYTYVTLNEGRWLIEHNQRQIIDEYQPTSLLPMGKGSAPRVATPAGSDIQAPKSDQLKSPMAGLGLTPQANTPPLPPAGTIK